MKQIYFSKSHLWLFYKVQIKQFVVSLKTDWTISSAPVKHFKNAFMDFFVCLNYQSIYLWGFFLNDLLCVSFAWSTPCDCLPHWFVSIITTSLYLVSALLILPCRFVCSVPCWFIALLSVSLMFSLLMRPRFEWVFFCPAWNHCVSVCLSLPTLSVACNLNPL